MALDRFRVTTMDMAGLNVNATVEYFDSTAPTAILATESFQFASDVTLAQMQAAAIARGQSIRTAIAKRASLAASLVGQVVTVP